MPANPVRRRKGRLAFIAACLLLALSGCASLPSHYEAAGGGPSLSLAALLARVEDERVLFLGEGHSDMSDHLLQAEVIGRLHGKGRSVIVALEAFPADRQPLLSAWGRGLIDEDAFERECDRIWADLFSYYGDLLRQARDSGIPLVGIGAPKGLINSVALRGLEAVPPMQRHATRFSGCGDDPAYERLVRATGVGGVHEMPMPFVCDAQRLSDTIMAQDVARLVRHNPQSVVIVIVGAAHAAKPALPGIFSRFEAVPYKVLLPARFVSSIVGGASENLADYTWY